MLKANVQVITEDHLGEAKLNMEVSFVAPGVTREVYESHDFLLSELELIMEVGWYRE